MKNIQNYEVLEISNEELTNIDGGLWLGSVRGLGRLVGMVLADIANSIDYMEENRATLSGSRRTGEW